MAIPQFDVSNPVHQYLASLSHQAHQLATQGKNGEEKLRSVQDEIDRKAAELWGLTKEELAEIQRSLAEIG